MSELTFTVCTPTFNRAHTLDRVFQSLQNQTVAPFEWIVVDDGSSDHTADLVNYYNTIAKFKIRYVYQANKGKHIAVNAGAKIAVGEFFLIADSDDSFPEDALQIFQESWLSIPQSDRHHFTGVTGLCASETGEVVGDFYPSDNFDSTPAETFYRYGIQGEKWGFHRTEVIREFPFPELKNFKFYAEGLIWSAIGKKYKTRYINRIVRIYHQDAGNQLTHLSPKKTTPTRIFYAMSLNADSDYLLTAPVRFAKTAAQGVRFSLHQSDTLRVQLDRLASTKLKIFWLICFPVGFVLYTVDNAKK